jgi:hypothetical protein
VRGCSLSGLRYGEALRVHVWEGRALSGLFLSVGGEATFRAQACEGRSLTARLRYVRRGHFQGSGM